MAPALNDESILSGSLTEQTLGVWHAEFELDTETVPAGVVTISLDEGYEWTGTVLRAREEHGVVRVKVVGGAGKLSTVLPVKDYANATADLVLGDILREAGETLSSTSEVSSHSLLNWHRVQASAAIALTALATELGLSWRVLRDGTVWLGTLAWAETTAEVTELDSNWTSGTFELVDALGLQPGTTYSGEQIHQVTHWVTPNGLRTEARLTSSTGVMERLLSRVRTEVLRGRIWPGTVASQSSDSGYPLEVLADGKDVAVRGSGLGRVQQLVGLPGFTVKAPAGARGAWTMLGGDTSRPRWIGWEQGGAASVTELCFNGGTKAVARVDDTVQAGQLCYHFLPGPPAAVALYWRAQTGDAWQPVQLSAIPSPPPSQAGTPLVGTITSGNTKFLA